MRFRNLSVAQYWRYTAPPLSFRRALAALLLPTCLIDSRGAQVYSGDAFCIRPNPMRNRYRKCLHYYKTVIITPKLLSRREGAASVGALSNSMCALGWLCSVGASTQHAYLANWPRTSRVGSSWRREDIRPLGAYACECDIFARARPLPNGGILKPPPTLRGGV